LFVNIIGVKFRPEGKIYNFDAADHIVHKNDKVIVPTENGLALGYVVSEGVRREYTEPPVHLERMVRKATGEDFVLLEENKKLEREARTFCLERIRKRGLAMKLIDVECLFEQNKIIFYFTAEKRVDFRELVKDLVQRFKIRIELKQIGARQETRMIKGLGICGQMICCAGVLQNLERVTVKMAKEQSMSLNPEKISGLCGRLMCCLAFEYDAYKGKKKNPKSQSIGEKGEPNDTSTLDLEKMDEDDIF
jgi:cell fate regulator YaaT (PSP1 superfamily)